MNEILQYIKKIGERQHLTMDEAGRMFQIIMTGGATPPQIAAVLIGLKINGETVDEITGGAKAVRAKAIKIKAPEGAIDTCGTGGDGAGTLNVSTAVAFVVAACGVPVAKHGNRSISSRSGSADVLKALAIQTEVEKDIAEKCLNEAGICFLFAPKYHAAMRHVGPVRQELAMRTIFNVLGPLSNPAETKYQLMGVYSKELVEPLAHVLKNLGLKKAWVVHGSDGLDELTITGKSYVAELKDGEVKTFEVHPEDAGLPVHPIKDIEGGDAIFNANRLKQILAGTNDAYRDIVLLNAAATLIVAGKAKDLKQGVALALEAIESGRARKVIDKLVEASFSDYGPSDDE